MRVFFAVDVHGPTTVWRKWIAALSIYEADALILSGDLTGKAMAPIIEQDDGSCKTSYFGRTCTLKTKKRSSIWSGSWSTEGFILFAATNRCWRR
ncbi:MAG: hypothetical protein WCP58_01985 [bacterium]